MEKKIDRKETVNIIKDVAQRYIEAHGTPPRVLIAVGGSAMILHGLRDDSEDVDLFSNETAVERIALDLEAESGYRVDVTSQKTLWGELNIHDIEQDAVVLENLVLEGYSVDIAAISPETLFVIKSSTMREKDRDDLFLIFPATSPEKIFSRFASLWKSQEISVRSEALINIVSEVQLVTKSPVSSSWFSDVPDAILKRWAPVLEENFPFQAEENHDTSPGF